MINFLEETLAALEENGKTPEDVIAVICDDQKGSFRAFAKLADFRYDNGYGLEAIESSLMIIGDDWWLERGEYDGSEWWEFKKVPRLDNRNSPLENVVSDSFEYLRERGRAE